MSPDLIHWPALGGAMASVLVGSLFAGADTALTSLSGARLEALLEQSNGPTKKAYERIQSDDTKIRSRYLVGRIASTAVTAVCFCVLFDPLLGAWAPWASLVVTLVLNATLFEISTTLARKHADAGAAAAARYLRPLELLTLPFAAPLGWLASRLGPKPGETPADPRVTEAEVEALVDEGERSGLFGAEPAEMIRNVLEFSERTAKEVMIPRARVEAIEIDTPVDKALEIVAESGHSRYPVYREQLDNIVGLLYAKDLFKVLGQHRSSQPSTFEQEPIPSVPPPSAPASSEKPGSTPEDVQSLKDIIRSPANFVAESQLLSSLLREMRIKRQHLAVVVDEFGGVSGVVTLEDVLEEIVGDIRDEHDDAAEPAFQDLGDGRVVAHADVSMRELSAYLGTDLGEEGEYESLGGMLTQHLGKIPEVGTAIDKFGLHFIVRDSDETHIGKVEIVRPRDASA